MRRKRKMRRLLLGMLFPTAVMTALIACGDDLSIQVPAVSYQDLAQPIGGYGAQEDNEEDNNEENKVPPVQETTSLSTEEGVEQGGNAALEETDGPEVVTITISAAGDTALGNHKEQDYGYSFRQAYDQAADDSYFFENVYDIFSEDDMTIVNLEGPLTDSENAREGQVYSIKGDPGYAGILTRGSVEAVSMGNNHRLDYGTQGSDDTVAALEKEGIVYAFEENTGIYEVKGIKIGIVSVNEVSQGAAVEKTIQEGITGLKEQGADVILVCCHWGVEGEYEPEDYQKSLGKKCIDWGADLVIGHHPHVLQGIEEYQGKYIVYSLGNFCFGANRNPTDKDCMIFQQTFTFVDGEKQEESSVRVIPCSVSSTSSRNDFKPTPAKGQEALRILEKINGYSKAFGVEFDQEGYR